MSLQHIQPDEVFASERFGFTQVVAAPGLRIEIEATAVVAD